MAAGQSDAERAIAVINMEECYRRRLVRGRDLNEWHMQLEQWASSGNTAAQRTLLQEIIAVTELLPQYDAREPQPYWHEKLADLHVSAGESWAEAAVLTRWLACWPEERRRFDSARERFLQRLRESYAQAAIMVTASIGDKSS